MHCSLFLLTAEKREQVQVLDWALEAETVLVLVAEVPMAAVSNIEGGGPGRGASTHAETAETSWVTN
jgi:hypothetical protein